jgi:hypothetical protein
MGLNKNFTDIFHSSDEKAREIPPCFFRASRNPDLWRCRGLSVRHAFLYGFNQQGLTSTLPWRLFGCSEVAAQYGMDRGRRILGSRALRTMAWLEVDERISNHPPLLSPASCAACARPIQSLLSMAGLGGTPRFSRWRGACRAAMRKG